MKFGGVVTAAQSIIDKSRDFTNKKIEELEEELSSSDIPNCSIVANGSYARKEASSQSDFDYFILHPSDTSQDDLNRAKTGVEQAVIKRIGKLPSAGGVFGATLECGVLSKNIGGQLDDNASITRRILFLIEGIPINNKDLFAKQRDDLLDR
jgi:predicted nucleotidyltransferase